MDFVIKSNSASNVPTVLSLKGEILQSCSEFSTFTPQKKNPFMTPAIIITVLISYFSVLVAMSFWTSRNSDSDSFFTGNKQSPWYLVAFGMIGTSLSGVTFISVPGKVLTESMAYFQIVLGYILGYIVIAKVLMPLYYKMNLVSIYEYLLDRFGTVSYKTGAGFFILSRTLGSAIRLYLATFVLQLFLFEDLGVPYWVTAFTTIALIWIYTFKGGVKTIVYTDAFQTVFLISSVVLCTVVIANTCHVDLVGLFHKITATNSTSGASMTKIFFFEDPNSTLYFPKQFFGGMFLAIAMTGLDQDLMQKNLTCKSLKDAQKNMYSFTTILVFVNFLFLLLGGALYVFAGEKGVDLPILKGAVVTDHVFPTLALGSFGTLAGVFFLLGITASSYASADSALTALTTGFCIDFLNFSKRSEGSRKKYRLFVHLGFSLLFFLIIIFTQQYIENHPKNDLIGAILKIAGYTYGPLLGLFSFGILSKRKLRERIVPFICIASPFLCYYLSLQSAHWWGGYKFGNELLILNGLITFIGLYLISYHPNKTRSN
jgi:SSS family transporter